MNQSTTPSIKRALISVSDKTGIVEFAKGLHDLNIEILSTGGTASRLQQANIPVTEVSDYTGFPEIMDGRVKTLNPKIHGGILARRDQDQETLAKHDIKPIDLVVVNLYPFQQVTADPACQFATAIENIDIGGPCMIRAAAKNHTWVTVITDPTDYPSLLKTLQRQQGTLTDIQRQSLAYKAFAHTAQYDAAITHYLQQALPPQNDDYPDNYPLLLKKKRKLRYGENPHQSAALYTTNDSPTPNGSITCAKQLQGKELSFNNLVDADTALECVMGLNQPACVIVKHANPCGVAIANTIVDAYQRAYQCDSTSAFGGIVAFNRPLNADTAEAILAQQFVEVIIAPEIEDNALPILSKKSNLRVLASGYSQATSSTQPQIKTISGGILLQDWDNADKTSQQDSSGTTTLPLKIVSQTQPTQQQQQDLQFAWHVCHFVKSNAIVYVKEGRTVGIGAGQMSRIDSAMIAASKAQQANLDITGAVMASDAFFPFRDSIDTAAKAGISAIIQPGGSKRDEEVITATDEHGIAMLFTGKRHFRH